MSSQDVAMTEIGNNATTLAKLVLELKDESSKDTRWWAAQELGNYAFEIRKPQNKNIIRELASAMHDKNETVRKAVALTLVDIGEPSRQYLEELSYVSDFTLKNEAILALRMMNSRTRTFIPVKHQTRIRVPENMHKTEKFIDPDANKINELIKYGLRERNNEKKRAAITSLEQYQNKAIQPLIISFKNADSTFIKNAKIVLQYIGGEQVTSSLIKALKDGNENVRKYSVKILGDIGDYNAIQALINTMNDRKASVRIEAIRALKKFNIKDKKYVSSALSLRNTNDITVRQLIIKILYTIEYDWPVDQLLGLSSEGNEDLTIFALTKLRNIQEKKSIDTTMAMETLIALLNKNNDKIGNLCIDIISNMDIRVKDRLIKEIDNYNSVSLIRIIEIFERFNDTSIALHLIQMLNSETPKIRSIVLEYYKTNNTVLSDIIDAIEANRLLPNREVFELLGSTDSPPATKLIINLLNNEKADIRTNAINALTEKKDKLTIPLLINAFRDSDKTVRKEAVICVGKFSDNTTIHPLYNMLKDESSEIRLEALEALSNITDDKIMEILKNVSENHFDKKVREAASAKLRMNKPISNTISPGSWKEYRSKIA